MFILKKALSGTVFILKCTTVVVVVGTAIALGTKPSEKSFDIFIKSRFRADAPNDLAQTVSNKLTDFFLGLQFKTQFQDIFVGRIAQISNGENGCCFLGIFNNWYRLS